MTVKMTNRAQYRRLFAIGFLMVVAFVCLGYRLVDLQWNQHEKMGKECSKDTHRTFLRAPKRGDIRDVRGNLLAGSIFVKTVVANPLIVGKYRSEVAHAIAPLLDMSEAEIYQRLQQRPMTNNAGVVTTNQFVVLKHKVLVETYDQIRKTMQQLPLPTDGRALTKMEKEEFDAVRAQGVSAESYEDQLRIYPNQSLAAHVLGYVGSGSVLSPGGKVDQLEGRDGIERTLDSSLKGAVGWRKTEFGKKQELVVFREEDVEAQPGKNVFLTLDAGVQHILETELAQAMTKHTPISASGVVIRPRTGEILAMATLPSFNPNNLDASVPDFRRNRVICDLAEPGSTFKIVVISGALDEGVTTLDEKFDCENGVFVFAGKPLHDHEKYGVLSVQEIIMHSSNIGAAKVGIKMGSDRLYQYMRNFGFGSMTGVPLVGERSGVVHPVKSWTKLSISRIPMGHEVAVTPLQMVMAMCAVANNGRLMRPMLVDRLVDDQGHVLFKNYPQAVRQVVSDRAARLMVTALKTVMTPEGTGRKAVLDHYSAAGKTGTAQKIVDGIYRRDKHFSSFVGFFPADDPEVCVAVFLDEPKNGYYGGEAAGPVFKDIAERVGQYLAIKPDLAPAADLTSGGAAGSALAATKHPNTLN
jgi:cell division protein FtsI/penicillin-binding protein 2